MKEEARSKKQLQATSGKKQEARKQQAAGRQVREVITNSKGKKEENKKEEARSKKQLQATSGKKQETRSQEATSGWKTGQRSKKQQARKQQAAGRQVREARNKKPGSNKRLEDRSES